MTNKSGDIERLIEPTEDEVERAFNAIKECMANEAWKIPFRNRQRADEMIRRAARQALRWAINPELAFKSDASAAVE